MVITCLICLIDLIDIHASINMTLNYIILRLSNATVNRNSGKEDFALVGDHG